MTHLEPEDILRRALREVAGSVEPAPDGLSRIQARLSPPRPLFAAWLVAAWETVSQFVLLRLEFAMPRLEPMWAALVNWLDRALPVVDRRVRPAFGWLIAALAWLGRMVKPQAGSEERPPPRYAWVRPVLAMGVVVTVAVAGGLAMSAGLPSQIARDGLNVFSGSTHGPGGGSHSPGGVTGSGKHLQPTSGISSTSGTAPAPSPTVSSSPKPKTTPKTSPSPHPSKSVSSPSQSPSTSPPQSPTPTPTDPSPTASTDDGG
jgi:hypothetical protein